MTDDVTRHEVLPQPTGRFPVGRAQYYWREMGDASGESSREVLSWIWYPAAPGTGARPASYLPMGWETAGQFLGFRADGVRSHAFDDAAPASDQANYPVLARIIHERPRRVAR